MRFDARGIPIPELDDSPANIETAVGEALDRIGDIMASLDILDVEAALPAAGIPRRLAYALDTRRLWVDVGAEWRLLDSRGAAGGALTGTYPNPAFRPQSIDYPSLATHVLNDLSTRMVFAVGGGDIAEIARNQGWRDLGEVAGSTGTVPRLPPVANLKIQTKMNVVFRSVAIAPGAIGFGLRTPGGGLTAEIGWQAASAWPKLDTGWVEVNPNLDGFFQGRNDDGGGAMTLHLQAVQVWQRYTR